MRRLSWCLGAIALGLALAACSGADDDTATPAASTSTTAARCTIESDTTLNRIDLKVGGKDRYALVHVPEGWDTETPVPLVLSFHGLSSAAVQQQRNDNFAALADEHGFAVAWPNAGGTLGELGSAWDLRGTSELDFVNAVVDDLEARVCIDPSRVYATGMSYGGALTDIVACGLSDRFAAAAPVSAYIPDLPCEPDRPVPILAFHGVEDELLPYDGGGRSRQVPFEEWGAAWAERNACATGAPTESQEIASVEALTWSGCDAPVTLYRVHQNGHTWPGHPLGLDQDQLVSFFSGEQTGKPYPLMVALGLTPEQFADTISLANPDLDASKLIWNFFEEHRLDTPPEADGHAQE